MSAKYIVECTSSSGGTNCTMIPWVEPPKLSAFQEYGFSGTTITWALISFVIVGLAFILATAIVRYRAHEARERENVARINKVVKQCPTCGDKV